MLPARWMSKAPTVQANKRIEPMRGSAVRLVLYPDAGDALPLMAHPRR